MAADVSYPDDVRYVRSHFRMIDNSHHTCFATAAAREASSAAKTADDGTGTNTDTDVPPRGGRLVRVPVDELQADIT